MKSSKKYLELLNGFKKFQKGYLDKQNDNYRASAAKGQSPKVMIIACCDSRVNPALLTLASLGEIFTINNVANIAPAFDCQKNVLCSTSAAIEFAVLHLKVEDIIILGHSDCGGIKALMSDHIDVTCLDRDYQQTDENVGVKKYGSSISNKLTKVNQSFIYPWVNTLNIAKQIVLKNKQLSIEQKLTLCEKQGIVVSLSNLKTFPFIQDAIKSDKLNIHGWYFDIQAGDLFEYSFYKQKFLVI